MSTLYFDRGHEHLLSLRHSKSIRPGEFVDSSDLPPDEVEKLVATGVAVIVEEPSAGLKVKLLRNLASPAGGYHEGDVLSSPAQLSYAAALNLLDRGQAVRVKVPEPAPTKGRDAEDAPEESDTEVAK